MKKKFIALISLILTAALFAQPALAAKSVSDLKKEMEQSAAEKKKATEEINQKQTERNAIVEQRNALDMQISGLLDDIDSVESVIKEKEQEISTKNDEIDQLTKLIDTSNDKLKTRMKIMYEYGDVSYLELVLKSKSFGDMLTRISVIRDIVSHDKELIATYITSKSEIEEARKVIETQQKEHEEVKGILDEKKDDLSEIQAEKQQVIDGINNDIKKLEEQEREAEKDYNALQAELNKAMNTSSSTVTYKGNGKFAWPSTSTRITSQYGYRFHPTLKYNRLHRGIDIGAPTGSSVFAGEDGKVMTAGWNNSYGYYITINHGGGYVTLYAHNSKLLVSAGQSVKRGQVIARAGSTGNSTGPHVHFEVQVNGSPVNPLNYL